MAEESYFLYLEASLRVKSVLKAEQAVAADRAGREWSLTNDEGMCYSAEH